MKMLIDCDFLFDGKKVIKDISLIVEDERIISIGKKGEFNHKESLKARFLMPGFFDMHTHITGYREGVPAGSPFKPMKTFLKLLLYNGITTVRDVGNNLETIMYLKKWGEKYPSPIIYFSGPLLDAPPLIWTHSRVVRSREEAEIEVERLYMEGVDFIKVYRNINDEILKIIIDKAHEKGLKVAGDLGLARICNAVSFGIDTIEHISNLIDETFIEDEQRSSLKKEENNKKKEAILWNLVDLNSDKVKRLIESLVKNDVSICPTLLVLKRLYIPEEIFREPNLNYMIPIMPYHRYFKYMQNPMGRFFGLKYLKKYTTFLVVDKKDEEIYKKAIQKMIEFIKIIYKNGVRIIAGTDTPNPSIIPGFSLHQEMKLLYEVGIKPLDVLSSGTFVASEVLGNRDLGRIEVGALANLLIINGNPSEDINDIENIEYVILKGKVFKREELFNRINLK